MPGSKIVKIGTEWVASLGVVIAHGRAADDAVGFLLLLADAVDGGICLLLLVGGVLGLVLVDGGRDDGKLHAVVLGGLEGTVRDELIVVHALVLGAHIDDLDFWARDRRVFIVLLAIDVEPLGGVGIVHLLLGDLGRLVVIEGV